MLWETFLLAQRAIRRNVLRSFLTILGIVIGVAAMILMVTLGSGATAKVTSEISKLGSNMLHVRPGQDTREPGGARTSADAFDISDVTSIQNSIAGLAGVAPVAQTSRQAIQGSANWSTTMTSSTNTYLIVQGYRLAEGRNFTDTELKAGKAVCMLGQTVRSELFGSASPIGKSIRLKSIALQVIGTLAEKGLSNFGSDQDDLVIIPLRTLQRRLAGNTDVDTILISAAEGVSTDTTKADIERLMHERRGIQAGQEDDFHVRDMKEIIDTVTGTTTDLTTLLSAVAAVNLLVGGIGIMNIMMVSVTERTRGIGTRLAIGALERDVMLQFLVEAVVLAACGGMIGIAAGLGASVAGAYLIGVPFVFKPGIVLTAFLFSGFVGVAFGYYPARKAAQPNPIEALRYD
ncbi:ABC transporter permease [uncultured Desulfosarcina sp.]|uniref:ABC transporter permease n=1 Tax=uncultured Desulfosarcina sp. TaxID=218289 RepID=UPI0029C90E33|nr:ABC transporter permease [uncultured Desulfosarcina sp.]